MTRIEIDPEDLRRVAREIGETAEDYLALSKEMTELYFSLPQLPSGIGSSIEGRVSELGARLGRLARYYDPDVAALRMSARIVEEDQDRALEVGDTAVDLLAAAYAIVEEVDRLAAEEGLTRTDAARRLGMGSAFGGLLDDVDAELPLRGVSRALFVATLGLDFMEQWERSDHNLVETIGRTGVKTGSGAVIGVLATRLLGLTGWGRVAMIAGAGLFGDDFTDDVTDYVFRESDPTQKERAALKRSSTVSGFTEADLEDLRAAAHDALMTARAERIDALVAAGVDRAEAEQLAETEYPDDSDAQLGP